MHHAPCGCHVHGDRYTIDLDPRRAAAVRDTIVSEVYRCIFDALVARINAVLAGTRVSAPCGGALSAAAAYMDGIIDPRGGGAASAASGAAGPGRSLSIGLLDLFGFESFEVNSFEQLCINYANEALQHFFVQCTFLAEELLHNEEGVPWQPIHHPDNREALDLLAKAPDGVFLVLDAVCRTPQATDATFANTLLQVHAGHPLLAPPSGAHLAGRTAQTTTASHGARGGRRAATQLRADEGFVLRHFAADVTYEVAGFLRKSAERSTLRSNPRAPLIAFHLPHRESQCAPTDRPSLFWHLHRQASRGARGDPF